MYVGNRPITWACFAMIVLTRSPVETTPTTPEAATTGSCRIRCSVMRCMHVSTLCSGDTVRTGDVMISLTGVRFEERPCRMTVAGIVAFRSDSDQSSVGKDQERANTLVHHEWRSPHQQGYPAPLTDTRTPFEPGLYRSYPTQNTSLRLATLSILGLGRCKSGPP